MDGEKKLSLRRKTEHAPDKGTVKLWTFLLLHNITPPFTKHEGVVPTWRVDVVFCSEPKTGRGRWCDFLCYVEQSRIRYYRRGTPVNHYSFISLLEIHKDPVETALHIQEANMDNTTQTKTHTERAAAGYMTTGKRSKRERERFPETSAFIPDVEDHVTFL
ncbi:hypothetical protein TNCV_4895661 [Trichonephila clavipes]|nr:hypothetical protein TNCV_4895661 [Trichonephila clavipes]